FMGRDPTRRCADRPDAVDASSGLLRLICMISRVAAPRRRDPMRKGNAMTTRKPDADTGTTGAARRGVAAEVAEETVRGGDFMRAPIFVDTRAAAELLRKLIEV